MKAKATAGFLLLLATGCVTSGVSPGTERSAAPCEQCEIIVENQTSALVTVSYYITGGRRVLGDLTPNGVARFDMLRPTARDGITLVAEIDGRDWCRGVIELPGRFVVGDATSCKPDRRYQD